MKHIFCENPDKAQSRLESIQEAASINLKKVVDLVDSSVINCEKCFEIYLRYNQDKNFEIHRILNNFLPEKIYDWGLLQIDEIFTAYRTVRTLKSAYYGFKSVVFLLKEKVKTNDLWSKVKVSRSEIGEKEINFLTSLPLSIPLVKAWQSILDIISEKHAQSIMNILNSELQKEVSIDIIDESFIFYLAFTKQFKLEKNLFPLFYGHFCNLKSFDTILKNLEYFKEFDILNDVIYNTSCTSSASFRYILENVENINIDVFVENGTFDNFVTFLVKEPISKDYVYNKEKLKLLFLKISLSVVKFPKIVLSTTIDKLCLYPDLMKYEQSAYPLLYIGLILDIDIKSVIQITSDAKFNIIYSLRKKIPVDIKYCSQFIILEIFREISRFLPYFSYDIAFIIAKYIKMNSSVAVEFIKIFGSKRIYLEQIEKNFIFQQSNLEAFLKILQFSAPDLILSLRSKAIMNKVATEHVNLINRYINRDMTFGEDKLMVVSSDSSDDLPDKSSPFKKIEIIIKKKKEDLENQSFTLNTSKVPVSKALDMERVNTLASFGSNNIDGNEKSKDFSNSYNVTAKSPSNPFINNKNINQERQPEGYIKIGRTNISTSRLQQHALSKQASIEALREIAARSKANNPEKEAVLIENCIVKNFKKKEDQNDETKKLLEKSHLEQNLLSKEQIEDTLKDQVIDISSGSDCMIENTAINSTEQNLITDSSECASNLRKRKKASSTAVSDKVSSKISKTSTISGSSSDGFELIEKDHEKPKASLSSLILNKSNSIFSDDVDVRSTAKENSSSTLHCYYNECLSLKTASPSYENQETPECFSSYCQYYNIFNYLRSVENIATIKIGILNSLSFFEGTLYSFDSVLRIKTRNVFLENNDLLYISSDKTKMNNFNEKELESYLKEDSFLGIVLSSSDGTFLNDNVNTNLVDVYTLKSRDILLTSKKLYFKICNSVTSGYREFLAIRNIQSQKILKYLLRPSFMSDFLQKAVHWDDAKQVIVYNKNNITHEAPQIIRNTDNEEMLKRILTETLMINESQASAVSLCYFSKEKFNLIQGPPGTGKTSTILALLSTFLFLPRSQLSSQFILTNSYHRLNRPKILVCAPSNTAIDVFVARLAKGLSDFSKNNKKINFLRVGVGAAAEINPFTLDYLVNSTNENISKSKIRQDLLEGADVICSTLNSCVSETVNIKKFDIIIIDEACQATEISSTIPLRYSPEKVILIGDPKQLPPTSISNQRALQKSLFERFLVYNKPFLLNMQYRMHPDICELSSNLFYNSKIMTNPEIAQKRLSSRKTSTGKPISLRTLNFIDVFDGKELIDSSSSFYNLKEAKASAFIAKSLDLKYSGSLKICILSPYKAQVSAIKSHVPHQISNRIDISTIDSFQGKECDIVLLSTVRTKGFGFICDFRRINVAITRAKIGLIILGNSENLLKDPVWSQIIRMCEKKGVLCKLKHLNSFNGKI